ncbi:MAG: hypothetical protein AB7P69_27545 [Candidatus Binatia bacterium]
MRATGVGVGITTGVFQFGYFGMSTVYLDPDCRVVLIPTYEGQVERFKTLLEGTPGLCNAVQNGGSIATKEHK